MTTDAQHSYGMAGRDFLRSPTVAERFDSLKLARKHSRLVSRLKWLLPLSCVAIFGLYFISPKISVSIGEMDASVAGIAIKDGNLRMINPKLEGVNDKQGAYVITAKYAEQAVANPDFMKLTDLSAEMNSGKEGWSRLTSPRGNFETKKETLELLGDIRVAQSNGMTAALTRADIDMKTQLIVSDQPVRVDFPQGKLDALTMKILMDTKEITFQDDVRVHLVRNEKKAKPAANEEKPGSSLAGALKSDAPIDILAPRLRIYDEQKIAIFDGGVTTEQAGSRMTSREMKIVYDKPDEGEAASKEPEKKSGTNLKTIDAIGDVRIRSEDGRTASSDTLHYDSTKQQLMLDNNVVITQQGNTIRGKRMITNLATGITRFPPLERVRGHFKPSNEKPNTTQKKDRTIQGAAQIDLSSTRGEPVDIESDTLEVNDKKRIAVFSGRVKVVQGKMTMNSARLNVNYAPDQNAPASGEKKGSSITSIRAEGRVLINTGDGQATTSDWALFRNSDQTVTIGGNVVLTQGENVIKGDQLVIDLRTNRSRFVNRGDPGKRKRVRGLFMPKQAGEQ